MLFIIKCILRYLKVVFLTSCVTYLGIFSFWKLQGSQYLSKWTLKLESITYVGSTLY